MLAALKSRKFWAAVAGAGLLAFCTQLKIDSATCTKIVAVIAAYIIGQGISDSGKSDASKH